MEKELERNDRYLVIDPGGGLRWINASRVDLLDNLRIAVDSEFQEYIKTVLPGIGIIVDDNIAFRPEAPAVNWLACRLYPGSAFGDYIFGPAVVVSIDFCEETQSEFWAPCSGYQLRLVARFLQIDLPEVSCNG